MNMIRATPDLESHLPTDLSLIIERPTLIRLAFEAVESTPWPAAQRPQTDRTPEPVLRTLMAFCYSVSVFASRDIESAARLDPSICYLCANDFPRWQDLRKFRRNYLVQLNETIARMLQTICDEIGSPVSFAVCLAEAQRRVRLAIEADSAEMDV